MIIVPGCGPVWPIRKPLKAFGFTVVVTRTEINQRSIGNSIRMNHQRLNNNYSFDTFAKFFELAYFYIARSLIEDGEEVDVLRSPDSKFDWEWLWNDFWIDLWIDRLDFLSITCFSVEKWICFVDLNVKSGPRLITSPNVFWSWLVFSLFYYRNYSDL